MIGAISGLISVTLIGFAATSHWVVIPVALLMACWNGWFFTKLPDAQAKFIAMLPPSYRDRVAKARNEDSR